MPRGTLPKQRGRPVFCFSVALWWRVPPLWVGDGGLRPPRTVRALGRAAVDVVRIGSAFSRWPDTHSSTRPVARLPLAARVSPARRTRAGNSLRSFPRSAAPRGCAGALPPPSAPTGCGFSASPSTMQHASLGSYHANGSPCPTVLERIVGRLLTCTIRIGDCPRKRLLWMSRKACMAQGEDRSGQSVF